MYSPRTSLTQPSMCTGRVRLGSLAATATASAGTSLSTALNVQLLCPSTVSCTWLTEAVRILTASAILRDTVMVSTKEGCVWDSGSAIAPDMEVLTLTPVGIQCLGSISKKFLKLRLKSRDYIRTC